MVSIIRHQWDGIDLADSTEQPEVAGDSVEVYQLSLDFDFVNNLSP